MLLIRFFVEFYRNPFLRHLLCLYVGLIPCYESSFVFHQVLAIYIINIRQHFINNNEKEQKVLTLSIALTLAGKATNFLSTSISLKLAQAK